MDYRELIGEEVAVWKQEMTRQPSALTSFSRRIQTKINSAIPDSVHKAITAAIQHMTRAFMFGSEVISSLPMLNTTLQIQDAEAQRKIQNHTRAATAEGAISGAGGFLLGLADFPIWLAIKMKMLSEIALVYGKDIRSIHERLFILHIFQLTFSSQPRRSEVFKIIEDWSNYATTLPATINEFEWQKFQQEYRDFIDVAKLLQLVPGIGAVVGAAVNHRYTLKLGRNAMNAYRLRAMVS